MNESRNLSVFRKNRTVLVVKWKITLAVHFLRISNIERKMKEGRSVGRIYRVIFV